MGHTVIVMVSIILTDRNAPAIHTINIVNELAKLNEKVVLLCPAFQKSLPVELDERIEIVQKTSASAWKLPNSFNTLFQLFYLFKIKKSDTLYLRSSLLTLLPVLLARALGLRVITEYNGWFADELGAMGYNKLIYEPIRFFQKTEARLAHKIRVVTKGLKSILKEEGIDPQKIVIISNGVDPDVFQPADRRHSLTHLAQALYLPPGLKLSPDTRYMAFVGNLWVAVDFEVVLDALALVQSHHKDLHLLVAGDGRQRAHFEHMTQQKNLRDHVSFLGALEQAEVQYVLGASDFAVAPLHAQRNQRIGVSPLKVYEYAACGTPIIATHLPGLTELDHYDWLSLAPAGNPQAWATCMLAHLDNIDDLPRLAHSARQTTVEHFSWSHHAQAIQKLLDF